MTEISNDSLLGSIGIGSSMAAASGATLMYAIKSPIAKYSLGLMVPFSQEILVFGTALGEVMINWKTNNAFQEKIEKKVEKVIDSYLFWTQAFFAGVSLRVLYQIFFQQNFKTALLKEINVANIAFIGGVATSYFIKLYVIPRACSKNNETKD